jgi:hypothetical protein
MGQVRLPPPVLLVVALFSRYMQGLEWSIERLEKAFGAIIYASFLFDFSQTRYYEPAMGPGLKKMFVVFDELVALDCLADVKHITIKLEAELAGCHAFPEVRPVNLDPGILTLGKFMLATTKDQSHRIYLRDGILAEATLRFQAGEFQPWPWTYADYRQPLVRGFFREARDIYRKKLKLLTAR